jgi:hypothetical protein
MNELQWIGLIIKPLDYSLKGGILHIDAGPGLKIEESHLIEIEGHDPAEGFEKVPIEGGKVALPDWASDVTTILWFPVRAIDENIARGTSSGENNNYIIIKLVNFFGPLNQMAMKLVMYVFLVAIYYFLLFLNPLLIYLSDWNNYNMSPHIGLLYCKSF